MLLGKQQAGSVSEYVWQNDGDVIDVDERLALDLLRIGHADFFEPDLPKTDPAAKTDDSSTAKEPANATGGTTRPKKTRRPVPVQPESGTDLRAALEVAESKRTTKE